MGMGASLSLVSAEAVSGENRGILDEQLFLRTILLERKRSERSRKSFLLMLLDVGNCLPSGREEDKVMSKMLSALFLSTRETDVTGWYKDNSVLGVVFTAINLEDRSSVQSAIVAGISESLSNHLTGAQFDQISISLHLFPEDWDHEIPRRASIPEPYLDLSERDSGKQFTL
jgi:hypothetical protein